MEHMKQLRERFDKIRGMSKEELGSDFWDLVVITASDETQRQAYEAQLQDKLRKKEIPNGLPYIVFADPPGPKVGCGVATMLAISKLTEMYGEKLKTWQILLLNAGGQSQRLPSASVLGKLFTPLPIEGTIGKTGADDTSGSDCSGSHQQKVMWQQLEMKLSNYLPYLKRMAPGYFFAASDDLIVYDLGCDDGEQKSEMEWNFKQPGFTALAHPSPLKIGEGHGVYVLKSPEPQGKKAEFRECIEVLQKPSLERMKKQGAIINDGTLPEPWVYTDSSFYFDHDVADKLLQFYQKEAPINCEIDAYGDFLQALGPRATIDYTEITANVSKVEPVLVEMRQKIFHLLKGTPINLVTLNDSKFYHFGTMDEYVYHMCEDKTFAEQMGFEKFVFSCLKKRLVGGKAAKLTSQLDGCIMQSVLAEGTHCPSRSIIEYCHFSCPLQVGSNSILSNCEYNDDDLSELTIPPNIFMHTVPVILDGITKYVTVAYLMEDNIKKKKPQSELDALQYLSSTIGPVTEKMERDKSGVFSKSQKDVSLWNARLFPCRATMSESFLHTLQMALCILRNESAPSTATDTHYMSMEDILQYKHVDEMIKFRNKLHAVITTHK